MAKAGLAAAAMVRKMLQEHDAYNVLVLAGIGNNGGDALVAARHLKATWHQVAVVFTGDREKLPADAAAAYDAWVVEGGELCSEIPLPGRWQVVVDGLFGIGLSRDLDARYCKLIEQVNALSLPVLALDISSGLCMATGRVLGAAIKARHTLSFIGLKPGLFTLDGPDYAGEVHLDTLGLEIKHLSVKGALVDHPPYLPFLRKWNCHKGSHGSVGVIGGADHMVGAAILASRTALLLGAGRVYCGLLATQPPALDTAQVELMLRDVDTVPALSSVLVVGPGMGMSSTAMAVLHEVLEQKQPMVLDADALNLVATDCALQQRLKARAVGSTVLTPHPGEAAHLFGCNTIEEVQEDRIAIAVRFAQAYRVVIVLKGCGSVIAMPDGRWFINRSGNPGMASAGMGDTLCGIIAALLAQSMALEQAVLLGVYLHGAAADALVGGIGPIGVTAGEVALSARKLLNHWVYGRT
ncbi:MAG: putative sugar kinase [Candidatus Tokpelaia sp. JSC085]|nr:MAG: putative sugar kinase [Candidatus Tokpelaia sp. JSC085]